MPEIDLTAPFPPIPQADTLDGLVWGYRFADTGNAEMLSGRALTEALQRQDSWLWLHFDLGDKRAHTAIASLPHLPTGAADMLLTSDDRPRIENFGDCIAGVVTDFERADTVDVRQMVRWQFVMGPHLFISARRRPLQTLNQLHRDLQSGRRIPGVLHLFDAIIHAFTTAMATLLQEQSEALDAIEEGLLGDDDRADYEDLGVVRRRIVRLHRQAVPLRATLNHLLTERPAWFTEHAAEDCGRVAARLDTLAGDLQALQERAHSLQDELHMRESETTNKRLTVLSVLTAMLLPPTLVTGLFGMNVEGLPFKETQYGFIGACAIMALSVVVMLWVLRRVKLI